MAETALTTDAHSFYDRIDERQREALLEEYLNYLVQRDGPIDTKNGTLPLRETSLEEMDSSAVQYDGEVSQADFDRLYANFSKSATGLTPELLLLLTFTKMNAGEAYGVRVVKKVHGRRKKKDAGVKGQVLLYAQEEEEYHTRILVGATHHFGLQAKGAYQPSMVLKVLIHSIAYAPQPLFHPILFSSEVAGVYVFNWTLNRIGVLLKGKPELQEALEQRLIEVLVDEIGHVAFNRLSMGDRGLRLGHALAPQVVRGLPTITPELGPMGFDRQVEKDFSRFDLSDLPEEVLTRGFFA